MLLRCRIQLLVATNRQRGQACSGERQSNGPCIMLHPNTTLHQNTPATPVGPANQSRGHRQHKVQAGASDGNNTLQLLSIFRVRARTSTINADPAHITRGNPRSVIFRIRAKLSADRNTAHRSSSRCAVATLRRRLPTRISDLDKLARAVASTFEDGGGRYRRWIDLTTTNGDGSLPSDC